MRSRGSHREEVICPRAHRLEEVRGDDPGPKVYNYRWLEIQYLFL